MWIRGFLLLLLALVPGTSALAHGKDLQITPLSPQLYLVKSYRTIDLPAADPSGKATSVTMDANAIVFLDQGDAYLIDTPWNAADMPPLMQWLKQKGATLKKVVATHSHADRTAGLAYLNANRIATYASVTTNRLLTAEGKATAQNTFSGSTFSLVPGKIDVFAPGAGHTPDNVVVWLPTERVLVGGCLLKALSAHTMGWVGDADMKAWGPSVRAVEQMYPTAHRVVPGHGTIGDASAIFQHTRHLVAEYNSTHPSP